MPPSAAPCPKQEEAGWPACPPLRGATAAKTLRGRTLTALYNTRGTPAGDWLDGMRATLNAAVAAVYGWPADLGDAEALSRLLALNGRRAAGD